LGFWRKRTDEPSLTVGLVLGKIASGALGMELVESGVESATSGITSATPGIEPVTAGSSLYTGEIRSDKGGIDLDTSGIRPDTIGNKTHPDGIESAALSQPDPPEREPTRLWRHEGTPQRQSLRSISVSLV